MKTIRNLLLTLFALFCCWLVWMSRSDAADGILSVSGGTTAVGGGSAPAGTVLTNGMIIATTFSNTVSVAPSVTIAPASAATISIGTGSFSHGLFFAGAGYLFPRADGVFTIQNVAGTDLNRIQFGGTTAAFPSLKRVNGDLAVSDGPGTGTTNNLRVPGSVIATNGLVLPSGSNLRAGNATLVAGTVTVNNTSVTANTLVMHARKTAGGTVGNITYTLSAGASFTLNSDNILDTSVVSYVLIENP